MKNKFNIVKISKFDKNLISNFISHSWGSPLSVSKGMINDTALLPGFICKDKNKIIGLMTYNIENNECEIVTLNSERRNKGLGTMLINKVIETAKGKKCKRVWLITTNDNTNSIKYYQKRGFEWVGFYKNAMIKSRKIKPEIPQLGNNKIPIKHELEFEYIL